ncbi:MAG: hypothetical protein KDA77_15210, partial [Planctomycetaceae bacterium]|nr:hypothetical protein [Planctomycetaceae bacterium]
LFSRATLVCISFTGTQFKKRQTGTNNSLPRIVMTGNPVRKQITEAVQQHETVDQPAETSILILGGSQGATAVNAAVVLLLEKFENKLPGPLHVIHQTGEAGYATVNDAWQRLKQNYPELKVTVQPFFDNLTLWYTCADLVISRAGATTLAELACLGLPAILIPFPNSIRDHQLINARYYAEQGAAFLVEQALDPEMTAQLLGQAVLEVLNSNAQRSSMSRKMHELAFPQAARRVAEEVAGLIQN